MKRVFLIAVGLIALPSLASAKALSWNEVKQLGGATLGEVHLKDGAYHLDTGIDVSGIKKGSQTMNSGRSCSLTEAYVIERTIYLTVHTGLSGVGGSAKCPAAHLGQIEPGEYAVIYKSKDAKLQPLGNIRIS